MEGKETKKLKGGPGLYSFLKTGPGEPPDETGRNKGLLQFFERDQTHQNRNPADESESSPKPADSWFHFNNQPNNLMAKFEKAKRLDLGRVLPNKSAIESIMNQAKVLLC